MRISNGRMDDHESHHKKTFIDWMKKQNLMIEVIKLSCNMQGMKCLIIAAGSGSRLSSKGNSNPLSHF